jgi:2,4-dienoyl-CoA reductase-like NADH-dependent reductase (Old Yellow Enzyme family)
MSSLTARSEPSTADQYANLLSPLAIRTMEVRNRVVFTAHGAFLDFYRPGIDPERYLAYQERRARGGAGLIILQPVHVHHTSHALGHYRYDADDLGEKLSLMAERLHRHGAKVMIQLLHFGAEFTSDAHDDLQPLWSFGEVPSPSGGEVAHVMTGPEIEEVIEGFATTAEIAVRAGLDGVEVHAAHGYLVQQSFSPWINRRDDEWGAPTRFVTEILQRIRARVGDRPAIGMRVSLEDFVPVEAGGVGQEGIRRIVGELVERRLVDLVNTSVGSRSANYARAVASYQHDEGLFLHLARALREHIGASVPVVAAGRVASPELAEAAVARGDSDLVAMTRAQIADPDLVRKLEGHGSVPVRPCVAANQGCVDRMVGGLPITCFHNPEVGREWRGHDLDAAGPAPVRRRVVIIGAGPAGLKAAEVAATRGHDVTVLEQRAELGGRLRYATGFGRAALLGRSVGWLADRLATLGVDVRTGVVADPALVASLAPDVVILATGSLPADQPVSTDGSVPVLSTDEGMELEVAGQRVLVLDRLGTHEAAQTAERLAVVGADVVVVTPAASIGARIGFTQVVDQRRRLLDAGCRIEASSDVDSVSAGVARVRRMSDRTRHEFPVDVLVAAVHRRADTRLRAALEHLGLTVEVVGDAVAPRDAMLAFREGADVALAIA